VIKNNNILGVILARAGSQRIVNKNLKKIKNKNLIEMAVETAIKSKIFNLIVLYSDIKKKNAIKHKKLSKNTIFLAREKKFSNSTISSEKTLLSMFDKFKYLKKYESFMLLQPTSPLRSTIHIRKAYNIYKKNNLKNLVSVIKVKNKNSSKNYFQRSNKTFKTNGGIYITDLKFFLKKKYLFNKTTYLMQMSKESSLDIDSKKDLKMAQLYLEKRSAI
jgi:CMP-N,N'-diacetyllegionaminic acid synthase